jgi:4-hydroxy-tetrahydrodipicolinate synthase
MRGLADFLLARGVDVLFPCGTTGEGMLLDLTERRRLAETVVEHAAGRAPVMIHTGCITTADTIALTRHAKSCGATAASVITPYFHALDDDSLFEHFRAVAASVPDFPIFLYAFPANARNNISPDLVKRLRAAAPNIVGMNSSNSDMLRFQEYLKAGGEKFIVLCGVDGLMLPALAVGAKGQVSGNANVFPELFADLRRAFFAGDMETARAKQRTINEVRGVLKDGLHPAYFKAALEMRGVHCGRVRPPMRALSPQELGAMRSALSELGLFNGGDGSPSLGKTEPARGKESQV